MAEAHPVGFQWVMEAKARGATIVHVDPRFTRTSAVADAHVPIRPGTDIAFLGGLINHVLTHERDFREYVVAYTNAPMLVREDFVDAGDDGLFSGWDPGTASYDTSTWQYEGADVAAASGDRDRWDSAAHEPAGASTADGSGEGAARRDSHRYTHLLGQSEGAGAGGATFVGEPVRDDTLQHPRCVYQVLKRHYARYTPEAVAATCGMSAEQFTAVAEAVCRNSGRERTTMWVYSVGWTQHTVGVQYIRAASILQGLLGNMGRPGGGIMALRGHATIQGSTDIPTLYDLLPGYIPMPPKHHEMGLEEFCAADSATKGFWGNMRAYVVSLLKAWYGDAATAENEYCFERLPRIDDDHSTFTTVLKMIEGECEGYFVLGENPAVGTTNAAQQRHGLAALQWLVVRDLQMIETATFWKDGPEIETGEMVTEDIGTEVFFLPAASHVEKAGSFTNTQRLLQWRHQAVDPPGDARSDLWFVHQLGVRIREKLAGSTLERDRAVLDLTWDYPLEGVHGDPDAHAVLAEISGYRLAPGDDHATTPSAGREPVSGYTELRDDGSTACGCWIYSGVYADGVNQAARRRPGREQSEAALEWGWAWPANRRILYNRASADPQGRPWSERKALVWWDEEAGRWTGHDVPDFEADKPPSYRPPPGAVAQDAVGGDEPFIMQADGRVWLYVPTGLADGPLPTHYEPEETPSRNLLHPGALANPARQRFDRPDNRYHPADGAPGAEVYPYAFSTFRIAEHHTAGGMSRWTPYLAELAPEMFVEVSPDLAAERDLEHNGWATIVTARGVIEARVHVTARCKPLRIDGRTVHQVGLPWHWGPNGLVTGDPANELIGISLDPNVHIMDTKTGTCDVRPGRRPRGADRPALVEEYRRRAGLS
jgi:formate dehydrogenase major subunit